jgi:hypothetical protein
VRLELERAALDIIAVAVGRGIDHGRANESSRLRANNDSRREWRTPDGALRQQSSVVQ